jgi:hypothetical protein
MINHFEPSALNMNERQLQGRLCASAKSGFVVAAGEQAFCQCGLQRRRSLLGSWTARQ